MVTAIVADELPLVCEGICALCEGICEVLGRCSDGDEAWSVVQRMNPDILLLDLNLPGLMPMEILRRTRQYGLATRVIVMAVRGDRKTVLDSLRAGASGYILKSGSARQIEDAFKQILRGGTYVTPLIELTKLFAPPPIERCDPIENLSSREQQVFSLLVEGIRAKEIAARLSLSPKTVDTYRASLMRKLDIHDVPGLVKFAIQHKMTQLSG
ncbi:MAG: response regulator transcription factor [Bryobacterales bacterium]|nr:response regulator transcription factor [Bryobacterales bacterium]